MSWTSLEGDEPPDAIAAIAIAAPLFGGDTSTGVAGSSLICGALDLTALKTSGDINVILSAASANSSIGLELKNTSLVNKICNYKNIKT